MPLVQDPGSLTALVPTPRGAIALPVPAANAFNDLFRSWHGLQVQTSYVMPRRLNRATFYRARLKQAVKL